MMDFGEFTHLTFDCYGTLIDWESGILSAVRPVLKRHRVTASEEGILRLYAKCEAAEEAEPYKTYRKVLRGVMTRIADELGFNASDADRDALAFSAETWSPFPDSVEALGRLKKRHKLAVVSNVDDEIFRRTSRLLGDPFDEVITAEQVGSYKPSLNNFRQALVRLGIDREQVLHVAQSLFHDHVPAKKLGLKTVRVNRDSRCPGLGATLSAAVQPDLVVPDLRALAEIAGT